MAKPKSADVVRGPAPVMSWTPPKLPPATDDTVMRLLALYRHTDPALAHALEERVDLAAIARAGATQAWLRTTAFEPLPRSQSNKDRVIAAG
jgi:uncharacterized protein (DUF1501 family)